MKAAAETIIIKVKNSCPITSGVVSGPWGKWGILDGDTIQLELAKEPKEGDIVLAHYNGNIVLRYYYPQEDIVQLRANHKHNMIEIKASDCKILGVATMTGRTAENSDIWDSIFFESDLQLITEILRGFNRLSKLDKKSFRDYLACLDKESMNETNQMALQSR